MTIQQQALLNAILDRPDDDRPRLDYSDWIEESGEPERAEFIRVQCELAGHCKDCFRFGECTGHKALRKRERELWAEHSRDWILGKGSMFGAVDLDNAVDLPSYSVGIVTRGFVAEVRAPLAVLVGGTCPGCNGTGMERYCDAAGDMDDRSCSDCRIEDRMWTRGTGQTSGIAREIAKCQPVTEWVATDKEPALIDGEWFWIIDTNFSEPPPLPPRALPRVVWKYVSRAGMSTGYKTRELALAALSAAIAKHAKQLARSECLANI